MEVTGDFLFKYLCSIHKQLFQLFFNSTYSRVSEYCAGCDNHKNIVESDPNRFELVKKIPAPTRKFSVELNNMFANSNEATELMEIEGGQKLVRFYDPSGNLIEVRTPISYN